MLRIRTCRRNRGLVVCCVFIVVRARVCTAFCASTPSADTFVSSTYPTTNFGSVNVFITSNNVTKLRSSDGVNQGTFPTGSNSVGVAFDGANIWVPNNGSNTVSKF
jgi:hypothetical protein